MFEALFGAYVNERLHVMRRKKHVEDVILRNDDNDSTSAVQLAKVISRIKDNV